MFTKGHVSITIYLKGPIVTVSLYKCNQYLICNKYCKVALSIIDYLFKLPTFNIHLHDLKKYASTHSVIMNPSNIVRLRHPH